MAAPIRIAQAVALLLGTAAAAAPAPYVIADHSSAALMSKAEALAIWAAEVDGRQRARVRKL